MILVLIFHIQKSMLLMVNLYRIGKFMQEEGGGVGVFKSILLISDNFIQHRSLTMKCCKPRNFNLLHVKDNHKKKF